MTKNYFILNLIENWEKDLPEMNEFIHNEIAPSKELLDNIMDYATSTLIYLPTLNQEIKLWLN